MNLQSLYMGVDLQRRSELERHAGQHIIASHQQQRFPINLLQCEI